MWVFLAFLKVALTLPILAHNHKTIMSPAVKATDQQLGTHFNVIILSTHTPKSIGIASSVPFISTVD